MSCYYAITYTLLELRPIDFQRASRDHPLQPSALLYTKQYMASMSSTQVDTVLNDDIIYDSLFDQASPATMIAIGQTCRTTQNAQIDYISRTFDINRHLGGFFDSANDFRLVQAKTGTLISGSNALQFMGRVSFPSSDLDLYVDTRNASELCDWIMLQVRKRYRFVPTRHQTDNDLRTPQLVIDNLQMQDVGRRSDDVQLSPHIRDRDFEDGYRAISVINFVANNDSSTKIQVVATHNTPIECILSFHSSEYIKSLCIATTTIIT